MNSDELRILAGKTQCHAERTLGTITMQMFGVLIIVQPRIAQIQSLHWLSATIQDSLAAMHYPGHCE